MIGINNDVIEIPGLEEQSKFVAQQRAKEVLQYIEEVSSQPAIEIALTLDGSPIDEDAYPKTHLLEKGQGWEPPHKDIVKAYFAQLKEFDETYSENGIARLLGLSSGRAVRNFKSGERPVPYDVWRRFLIATGRAPIDMPVIVGFFR